MSSTIHNQRSVIVQNSFSQDHPDAISAILKTVSDLGAQNLSAVSRNLSSDVLQNQKFIKHDAIKQFLNTLISLLEGEVKRLPQGPITDATRTIFNSISQGIASLKQLKLGLSFNKCANLIELRSSILTTKEPIIDILKNLNEGTINILLQTTLPSFFGNVFEVATICSRIRAARDDNRALRVIVRELTDIKEFSRAHEVANTIQDRYDQSYALRDIVNGFIECKEFDQAITTAITILDLNIQSTTLNHIAEALRQDGNFTLARLVPHMLQEN